MPLGSIRLWPSSQFPYSEAVVRGLARRAVPARVLENLQVVPMAGGQYFSILFSFFTLVDLSLIVEQLRFLVAQYEEECRRCGKVREGISCSEWRRAIAS